MLSHRREDILLNGSYQTVFQLIVSDEYDIMSEAPFLMFYCVIKQAVECVYDEVFYFSLYSTDENPDICITASGFDSRSGQDFSILIC